MASGSDNRSGTHDGAGRTEASEAPFMPVREAKPAGKRSWRASWTMLGGLLAGLAISLIHHFMNAQLDGQAVDTVSLSQSWVARFGTALAFLAKMFFTMSVGVAFVQYQWLMFHRQSFRIDEIDTLTSVLGNAFNFLRGAVWLRQPVMTLVGLVSWSIPIATVVPPGSLSVQPVFTTNTTSQQVPQPLYNYTNYATLDPGADASYTVDQRLYNLVFSAASSGRPVMLEPRSPNETYHLQFDGPALRCNSANDSLVSNLTSRFGRIMNSPQAQNINDYISWVPGDEQPLNETDKDSTYTTLDRMSKDGPRLFVMSNFGNWDVIQLTPVNYSTTLSNGSKSTYLEQRQVNVTECQLYNATYEVDFLFQYPDQTVNVSFSKWLNPVPRMDSWSWVRTWANGSDETVSYSAMMDAFGRIFVGRSVWPYNVVYQRYSTNYGLTNIDWEHAEAVQQGMEQLFQNFTLSLLSDPGLIKNSTDAQFLPVTVTSYPITYVYDAQSLLLAYGASLLCSALCCAAGLYAFLVNHGSYQNLFSTFVRVTNDSELRSLISSDDSGADPLPQALGKAKVRMMGDER